jgi:glycolate oxidase FAD binding subunit
LLEAVLAEKGQCLPFEPPHFALPAGGGDAAQAPSGGATVGGMVAAGLAGPGRAAVGSVRDYVLGATLLNGRAEVLSFGGQVMKNVAGYDVSRVIAGSMGVLGAICEVSLKVLPQPAATATLRFEMDQASAIRQLNEWAGRPLPLHASAWWQGLLVLRLAGAAAAVRAAAQSLDGEVVPPDLAAAFWTGLRDQSDEFFVSARAALDSGAALWRLSLPQTAPPLALDGDCLIEWGGAQRWLSARLPAATVRDAAAAAGGHATLFMGHERSAGVFAPLKSPLDRIHRELKRAFDPDGVFNPGRLYPGLCP